MSIIIQKKRQLLGSIFENMPKIKEFHLFAGIGGGIYGGEMLGHECCGGVEINTYCRNLLEQRQIDGWMNEFPIYEDITELSGKDFKGQFDILCGGFPCQAFSHAAHGKNIAEKNLWPYMLDFIKESDAPVVFGENVTEKAINKAAEDLKEIGYNVQYCRVSCADLGADHNRPRFWLLGIKDRNTFDKVSERLVDMHKLKGKFWEYNPNEIKYPSEIIKFSWQKKGIGNAQAPICAAVAFRILVNRHLKGGEFSVVPSKEEIESIYEIPISWISRTYPDNGRYLHTPTTMANYHCKSMMKHACCRKYVEVFGKPNVRDAEYLMGMPIGASSPFLQSKELFDKWISEFK